MSWFNLFRRRKALPEGVPSVTFDDRGISCLVPGEAEQFVAWASMTEVGIYTTNDGPCVADAYWVLWGERRQTACYVPQAATGAQALLVRLQELPGFDNSALISAMACAEEKYFACWPRSTKPA